MQCLASARTPAVGARAAHVLPARGRAAPANLPQGSLALRSSMPCPPLCGQAWPLLRRPPALTTGRLSCAVNVSRWPSRASRVPSSARRVKRRSRRHAQRHAPLTACRWPTCCRPSLTRRRSRAQTRLKRRVQSVRRLPVRLPSMPPQPSSREWVLMVVAWTKLSTASCRWLPLPAGRSHRVRNRPPRSARPRNARARAPLLPTARAPFLASTASRLRHGVASLCAHRPA